jgi:hypothetical protein
MRILSWVVRRRSRALRTTTSTLRNGLIAIRACQRNGHLAVHVSALVAIFTVECSMTQDTRELCDLSLQIRYACADAAIEAILDREGVS